MLTMSFVPTGLVFMLLRDPGTEVPGYFHGVPPGRRTGTFRGSLNVAGRIVRAHFVRKMGQPHMRPVRDATRIARHFSAGDLWDTLTTSPIGTAEQFSEISLVALEHAFSICVLHVSRPSGTRR